MNHNLTNAILAVGGSFIVAVLLLLIGREIVCWYWKINRSVELLEKIHAELVAARQTTNLPLGGSNRDPDRP